MGMAKQLAIVLGWPALLVIALLVRILAQIVKTYPEGILAHLWRRLLVLTTYLRIGVIRFRFAAEVPKKCSRKYGDAIPIAAIWLQRYVT
jgi:hypothetical protein